MGHAADTYACIRDGKREGSLSATHDGGLSQFLRFLETGLGESNEFLPRRTS